MDTALKLYELRRRANLTQDRAAHLSGVGPKTISSFETGGRINTIKLWQLEALLKAYGVTLAEFFDGTVERHLSGEKSGLMSAWSRTR